MRACSSVLLVLLPLFASALPPLQWQWLNPQPTGNHWAHVFAESSQRGIAVAENGEVAETLDAGVTWGMIGSGNPEMLISAASTLDGRKLFGSGTGGRIWKSDDAGKNWRSRKLGLRTYYGVCQFSSEIALVAGEGSSILRTRDGGESWRSVHEDSLGQDLLAIHCEEGGLAIAVGFDGAMVKSVDSGRSWRPLPAATEAILGAVAFIDSLRGYATGSGGTVLKTQDGGLHWTSQIVDSNSVFFRGLGVSESELVISGSEGEIWQSLDTARTWQRLPSGTPYFLGSLARFGSEGRIAVGNNGAILQSGDKGKSWINRRQGPDNVVIGITALSSLTWMAFGMNGLVIRTNDAGATWSELKTQVDYGWLAAGFWKERIGLLAGYGGTLMRTEDGGESWESVNSGLQQPWLDGVAWADSLTAIVVGDSGRLLRSTNCGKSFESLTVTGLKDQTLSAIQFLTPEVGIVIGYQGLILKTENGGRDWKAIPSPTQRDLFALSFSNALDGIAVGHGDTVIFTHDGGNTWEAFSTGSHEDYLYGVALLGADTAIAVGEWLHYAVTRITTDGGATWSEIPNATFQALNGIVRVQPGRVVALGAGGAVLSAFVGGGQSIPPIPQVADSGEGDFQVRRLSGSPFVQFKFTLPFSGAIQITAFSMTGKTASTRHTGNLPAGSHRLTGTSAGPNGIYRLTLTGAEKTPRVWYSR